MQTPPASQRTSRCPRRPASRSTVITSYSIHYTKLYDGEAANGVEAVEKYRELGPDLMTMDIVMPLKSGIEALQQITAADPQACVVMCSALGQEALILEAVQAGARDFIIKPFREERVLEVVRRVTGAQG